MAARPAESTRETEPVHSAKMPATAAAATSVSCPTRTSLPQHRTAQVILSSGVCATRRMLNFDFKIHI